MITVTRILVIAAIVGTCVNAAGKMPLWPSVLVLAVADALRLFP